MDAKELHHALITEAARPSYRVIEAGTELRGHCGTQDRTIIKLGSALTLKELRPLFKRFLTLASQGA